MKEETMATYNKQIKYIANHYGLENEEDYNEKYYR